MGGSAADACRVTSRPAITTENQRWHQLFRNQRKLAVSARSKPAPRLAPTQAHTTEDFSRPGFGADRHGGGPARGRASVCSGRERHTSSLLPVGAQPKTPDTKPYANFVEPFGLTICIPPMSHSSLSRAHMRGSKPASVRVGQGPGARGRPLATDRSARWFSAGRTD